jgi:hypothetical protein
MTEQIAVYPPQPWTGRASDLISALTKEVKESPPGTWTYADHRGMRVWLQLREDGRRTVRISRDTRPATAAGWDRLHEELNVLKQHLGVSRWPEIAAPPPAGSAWSCWLEEPNLMEEIK